MPSQFQLLKKSTAPELRECVFQYQSAQDELTQRAVAERYIQVVDRLLQYITRWQFKQFYPLGVSREDLLQWARIAALEALQRYNSERGTDFCAYLSAYVRRFVYNKVLDELPVPRGVSKQIRKYTRKGWDVSQLPQPLQTAFHLRTPITVDACIMADLTPEENTEDEDFSQQPDQIDLERKTIQALRKVLGRVLWQDLRAAIGKNAKRWFVQMEHLSVQLYHCRRTCPADLLPYLNTLYLYVNQLMERRSQQCTDTSPQTW